MTLKRMTNLFLKILPLTGSALLLSCANAAPNSADTKPAIVQITIGSDYTSLKSEDCKQLETNQPYNQWQCAAKEDYQLQVVGSDLRFGAEVIYGNLSVAYHQPIPPSTVGDVAEWRYTKQKHTKSYHALIYRMRIAQAETSNDELIFLPKELDRHELIVIRLDKEHTCLLGNIPQSSTMNIQARKLADNMSAKCLNSILN